jgi:hypothetical protein
VPPQMGSSECALGRGDYGCAKPTFYPNHDHSLTRDRAKPTGRRCGRGASRCPRWRSGRSRRRRRAPRWPTRRCPAHTFRAVPVCFCFSRTRRCPTFILLRSAETMVGVFASRAHKVWSHWSLGMMKMPWELSRWLGFTTIGGRAELRLEAPRQPPDAGDLVLELPVGLQERRAEGVTEVVRRHCWRLPELLGAAPAVRRSNLSAFVSIRAAPLMSSCVCQGEASSVGRHRSGACADRWPVRADQLFAVCSQLEFPTNILEK